MAMLQVCLCLLLALGTEGHRKSSIQFPPVVTTYSVPVPVFGGDNAIEGVLTAARITQSGDLSGNSDQYLRFNSLN